MPQRPQSLLLRTLPLLLAGVLAACGGGGSSGTTSSAASQGATVSQPGAAVTPDAGAPLPTGLTATDGFNWFNYRRQQLGLRTVARNAQLDTAALGHSNYQRLNNVITHDQVRGRPGYTGVNLGDRITEAGYRFATNSYAYGEVISATSDPSGFNAAEDLIAAIYHRFVIFEPMFKEAGVGSAAGNGTTYFTTNFAANGLNTGLGARRMTVYPVANQGGVPRNFLSDNESPDPVPGRNEVGYPISVHADIVSTVTVQSFTLRQRGGQPLPVQLLTSANDAYTPSSAAAIIPINVLSSNTTYDVQFVGTVDGADASRSWSFTTQ